MFLKEFWKRWFCFGKGGRSILEKIIKQLRSPEKLPAVVVGFDGYVDSILRVCRQTGGTEPEFFDTMEEFGNYIRGKAWKSCSLELKLQTEKLGGNAPIFSQTISRLGAQVSCIGAFGTSRLHPVFRELEKLCALHSISDPGLCEALEFRDGKVMLARNDCIKVDYDSLLGKISVPHLLEIAEQADMLAFFNWSELPGATSIWQGCLREIFPQLTKRKRLLIDLSDCSQRPEQEVREAGRLIREFSKYLDVVLSLNQNEAETLSRSLKLPSKENADLAAMLREHLACEMVVLHLLDRAFCASEKGVVCHVGRQIQKPLLSTGGGDNFNAGFAFALLQGMSSEEALAVANGVSGFYVSQGRSPDREELAAWLEENFTEKSIEQKGKICYESA